MKFSKIIKPLVTVMVIVSVGFASDKIQKISSSAEKQLLEMDINNSLNGTKLFLL